MTTQQVDRVFRAFADENRLRILHLLKRKEELCVCELIEVLHMGQSKVSRHLAYLKRAGLVKDRKKGLWRYYSLTKSENGFHKRLIGCLDECFGEVSILKKDASSLKHCKSVSK
ncbi:MAG: winged helix-turn-helix transcriptional regulator [Elusimicrobia bacterium]|nr:winged helix-turn-helix transcriptional regulator [Elusimicrobiota bacterium]